MSEIQLSRELAQAVQGAIAEHDAQARDELIAIQYLAALTGYMLGNTTLPSSQKRELLGQLHGFSEHVLQDMERSQAPKQEAFGIWRPGDA